MPGYARRGCVVLRQLPAQHEQAGLAQIDKQVDQLVDRIVETSVPAVVRALEEKLQRLENEKLLLREKSASGAAPRGNFDLRLRTALAFIANPWNLWSTGRIEDRRAVLKLTFADRLRYKRGEGFRTANLTLPFKVLADVLAVKREWRTRHDSNV
ncbi:hypothetical protein [Methylobacterium organophilum]|uniref:hypothetical protein n=1 Tax=Methylobacterium organophilum TaxID=410 RepID=UPI001EE1CD5A|nr:hypothetical protein [Methylobacterium organophilum]